MFGCKCLNISIKAKTSDLPRVDVVNLSLSVLERSDPFFKEDLVEAEIISISKEQPCLVKVRNVASWIVHQCINCRTDTHALDRDRGAACVLINSKTLMDKSSVTALKSSTAFSPVFRIVVSSTLRTESFNENMTDYHTKPGVQTALAALQQQLTESLQHEAHSVEERIRQFSEKQYTELEEFRSKAHDDHKTLARVLIENENKKSAPSHQSSQSQGLSPWDKLIDLPPPPQRKHSKEEEIRHPMAPLNSNTTRHRDSNRQTSNSKFTMSPAKSEPRPVPSIDVPNEFVADSEGVFQLDGMDENPPSTFQSEDETDTEADASVQDDFAPTSRVHRDVPVSILAKSLPVSVPVFPGAHNQGSHDEEDDLLPQDPVDIAASIKALARSVHGDTIFGDLPRPRFSSQI